MFIQKVINLKMAVTNVRTWEKQEIDLRRLAWDFGSAVLVSTAARSWELPTSRRRVYVSATYIMTLVAALLSTAATLQNYRAIQE